MRGPGGRGFEATPDPLSAYPQITALTPARPLRIGDTVHAAGTGLSGDTVTAQFASTRLANPVQVPAAR